MNLTFKKNGFVRLDDGICIVKSAFFPYYCSTDEDYRYEFVLGLGGNLGCVVKRFEKFFQIFRRDPRFFVLRNSPILRNKAFGYTEQDDFLNAVMIVKTSKQIREVLKILQNYEKKFGRKRSFKNAPRTLDLDILYSDQKTRKDAKLILPHYGAGVRISVIFPLGAVL